MPESLILIQEDLAQTCFRTWHLAGGVTSQPWEHLSLESQMPWLRLAKRAEEVLTRMEGSNYQSVGEELMRLAQGEGEWRCSPRDSIAWQGVARHLAALLDSDEIESGEDLLELEASWSAWGEKKRESLITRSEDL